MDNTFYTCPYCKEEYINPSDLAHCILSCEDKKKVEEEKRKKEELALKKEARQKELDEAFENWNKLRREFIKDYGYYSTSASESFKDIDSITETLFGFKWF